MVGSFDATLNELGVYAARLFLCIHRQCSCIQGGKIVFMLRDHRLSLAYPVAQNAVWAERFWLLGSV